MKKKSKKMVVKIAFSICFLFFFMSLSSAQAQMMGGGNIGQMIISSELDSDESITIDGKKDSSWTFVPETESIFLNDVEFAIQFAHNSENLYVFISIDLVRPKTTDFETVALYFASCEAIEEIQSVSQNSRPVTTFERPDEMPSDVFGGDTFDRSERFEIDFESIEDRKAITIEDGFDDPSSSNFTSVDLDTYIYENDDEDNPYLYERDLNSMDFVGAGYMDRYSRGYEFQISLNPNDRYNDVNISSTQAFKIQLSINTTSDPTENFSMPFTVQLFEPLTIEVDGIDLESFEYNFLIFIFVVVFIITGIGGIIIWNSRSKLKDPSVISAYRNIKKEMKRLDEIGPIRSEKEKKEALKEEKLFEKSLSDIDFEKSDELDEYEMEWYENEEALRKNAEDIRKKIEKKQEPNTEDENFDKWLESDEEKDLDEWLEEDK